MTKGSRVAIQGVAGSYSAAALARLRPDADALFCDTFDDAFAALGEGRCLALLLPFENSTTGFLSENYRRLRSSGFKVCASIALPIEHALLALPGSQLSAIRTVRSHPQALRQCAGFLKSHGLEPIEDFDTAGAAAQLKDGEAALASPGAAAIYGLSILAEKVNDQAGNHTRFFWIETRKNEGRRLLLDLTLRELSEVPRAGWINLCTIKTSADAFEHRHILELECEDEAHAEKISAGFAPEAILGLFEASAVCPQRKELSE